MNKIDAEGFEWIDTSKTKLSDERLEVFKKEWQKALSGTLSVQNGGTGFANYPPIKYRKPTWFERIKEKAKAIWLIVKS